jgi:hypothetical protein
MPWLVLLFVALVLVFLGRYSRPADEVYTLAIYCTGILSALWGFAIAPTLAQLMLTGLAFGWLQFSSPTSFR